MFYCYLYDCIICVIGLATSLAYKPCFVALCKLLLLYVKINVILTSYFNDN